MAKASLSRGLLAMKANVDGLSARYNHVLDDKIKEAAADGEAYMKEHAPWRDNTGNRKDRVPGAARATLFTAVTDSPLVHNDSHKEILFSHGVYYGIFLETKHSGKDEIIMPSVKHIGEEFMAGLEETLSELREREA